MIYLSFLGVRGGRNQLSLLGRYLVAPLILRNVVADHEQRRISSGGAAWTGQLSGLRV